MNDVFGRAGQCVAIAAFGLRVLAGCLAELDEFGRPVAIRASGLLARCIQHESDHLDGVLFLTRMEPEQRKAAMAEIRAAEWFQA